MLVRLGDLLRAVFRSQVQQEVPLSRELTLLEQYLDIQRVRFAGHLRSAFDIDEEARGVLVPVLPLQPLAENAIKHGFGGLTVGGTVSVTARRFGDQLGAPRGRRRARAGRTIDARSARASGWGTPASVWSISTPAHTMSAGPAGEGGFQVTIRLPWRRDASEPLDDALDIPA